MAGHDWTSWLYWIGGALLALLGLSVVLWALFADRARGRKRCPKCWYDLSGIAIGDSTMFPLACSECGKHITHFRGLSKTRRRWRWAFVAALLIVIPAGFFGWRETRSFNWNTVKPVWLLKRQGKVDSPTGEAARKELVRRMRSDVFSIAQVHDLAEFVLEIQADPNAFWQGRRMSVDSTWGDLFEEAWDQGHLTKEQISRYLETGFGASFTVTPRAKVRAGAVLPIRFKSGEPRLSHRWHFPRPGTNVLVAMSELRDSSSQLRAVHPTRIMQIGSSRTAGAETTPLWHCDFAPGVHTCSFEFDFVVIALKQDEYLDGAKQHLAEFEGALASWRRRYDMTFEVLDGESIQRVPDPKLVESIRSAVAITIGAQQLEKGRSMYGGRFGIILIDPLPVAVSFDVFGRAAGHEHKLGSFACTANRSDIDNVGFDALKNDPRTLFPDYDAIDLILRTNPEPAERTVEIDSVWDGEIVIENVPLNRSE